MSVILITNWRAARQARNLQEELSPNPAIRARARARSLAEVKRREQRAKRPYLAEVVYLSTWIVELGRKSWSSRNPRDY